MIFQGEYFLRLAFNRSLSIKCQRGLWRWDILSTGLDSFLLGSKKMTIGETVNKILSFLHLGSWNVDADARRKYIRYSGVPAEVTVGNRAYSIRDWSHGGISF